MAKKEKLQATATQKSSVQDEFQKALDTMVKLGEALGTEIIGKLAQYGNSYQGLWIETYAVCVAYTSLKVIAKDAGWDNEPMFQKLQPRLINVAKELLEEVKNLENV